MSPTRIALLLSFLSATAHLPAQPPSAASTPQSPIDSSQSIPTIHITSRLVELDVVVVDAIGNPVKGLKQSDFALTEDGVPQSLVDFTEHDASSSVPVTPAPPLPPNTFAVQPPPPESVTKTVIVLDQLHYPSYPFVRADIRTFMQTVAAGNPICIIRLDWRGLHLVQDFTLDPQLLQEAIDGPRMLPPLPNIDPLNLSYRGISNPYRALARYLDGVPGRINLAWVTDAGKPDDFIGQEYPDIIAIARNLSGSTDVVKLSRINFYAIQICGYVGCGNPREPPDIPDITPPIVFKESLTQLPGDPPLMPAATGGGMLANQALADLATSLGGHAFFDGTDKALAQILAVGSQYYTLSYVPTNPNWNGKYRQIAINVSGIPQTAPSRFGWTEYGQPKATYRRGYYAKSTPDPNSERNLTSFGLDTPSSPALALASTAPPGAGPRIAQAMEKGLGFGTFPPSQINFTIAVSPSAEIEKPKAGNAAEKGNFVAAAFRDLPYRNYRVHFWIDPKDLQFSRLANGSYRDDLRFFAIVYSDDGLVANSVSTTAHIQVSADNLQSIMTDGVIFDENISIPARREPAAVDVLKPNFFLRTAVTENSTGHIGALEVPVETIKLPPTQTVAAQGAP